MHNKRLSQANNKPAADKLISDALPAKGRDWIQYVVPIGTVASRIRSLQSLTNPLSTTRHFLLDTRRYCGDSRLGFGKRITNRFGSPASRKTMPDDEVEIETAHSFLGLSTPRISHGEIHATSGDGFSTNHKRRVCRGTTYTNPKRDQRETASLNNVPARCQRNGTNPGRSIRRETIQYNVTSPSPTRRFVETAIPITTFRQCNTQSGVQQQTESQPPDTVKSNCSFTTASTVRRQSVRDLFRDHGIERPSGLASTKNPSREDGQTPRPQGSAYATCHACSKTSRYPFTHCSGCGYRLCARCGVSVAATHHQAMIGRCQNVHDEQRLQRPKSTPVQVPVKKESSSKRASRPPTKFTSFTCAVGVASKASLPNRESSKHDRANSIPRVRLSNVVKKSPFFIADLSIREALQSRPVLYLDARRQCHNSSALVSTTSSYTSSGYRHSILCSKNRRRAEDEVDFGYVADISRIEENHPRLDLARVSRPAQPSFNLSQQEAAPSHISGSSEFGLSGDLQVVGIVDDSEPAAYVECRGYPRTGHGRHGNPVSTGIIGECQHCLDDCQCSACQATHHSVRCCIHQDHSAMVHHHLTPRAVGGLINPFEGNNSVSVSDHRSRHVLSHSPPCVAMHNVPLSLISLPAPMSTSHGCPQTTPSSEIPRRSPSSHSRQSPFTLTSLTPSPLPERIRSTGKSMSGPMSPGHVGPEVVLSRMVQPVSSSPAWNTDVSKRGRSSVPTPPKLGNMTDMPETSLESIPTRPLTVHLGSGSAYINSLGRNSIPELRRMLKHSQEELRRIRSVCDAKLKNSAKRRASSDRLESLEVQEAIRAKNLSRRAGASEWSTAPKLSSIAGQPTQDYEASVSATVQKPTLPDTETFVKVNSKISTSPKQAYHTAKLVTNGEKSEEFVDDESNRRYTEMVDDLTLRSITVIVRVKGRQDLVLELSGQQGVWTNSS